MTPKFLLDTNIVSDLIRNPQGRVADQIKRVGEDAVCVNPVVAGEIRFGVLKRRSDKLARQAERILRAIRTVEIKSPTEVHYAAIRWALEKAGTPIGPNDLWIAAHAKALDMTVVTANEAEFSRVEGLRVENWLCRGTSVFSNDGPG